MTLTVEHAAANLAAVTKRIAKGRRYVGVVASITNRETTGNVTVSVFFRTNPITVQMRNNVDVAADDVIFIKEDPAVQGVFIFDGFAKGGGAEGANNDSGDPIPWAITPGVTSPPGDGLTIAPASGQSTFFASGVEINAATADEPVLILQTTDDNSANPILEVQDSNAAVLANVTPTGGALFSDKVIFTQTDGDEAIDSLADGYMDYLATTAHRFNTPVRGASSLWWRIQHVDLVNVSVGASGAVWTSLTANHLSGYQLDADTEYLYFNVHIGTDWDEASDLELVVQFETNVDNSGGGGSGTDTVDFDLLMYYKGATETAQKTQSLDASVVVGEAAQYYHQQATFTIDFDKVDHVVQIGDCVSMRLNLDTTDSEVDNVIVHHAMFRYKTNKVRAEV